MKSVVQANRRAVLKLAGAAALSLGAPTIVTTRARAAGTRKMTVQLGWLVTSQQIGEVVAAELGYYEEDGIVVEFFPGGPNIDPVPLVASGSYDIGQLGSSPSIMLASSRGIPIQCFAVALQIHPFAYFSLPSAPIRTPQDMIGRKIGIQAAGGAVLLSALLRRNGIDESKVEFVTIGSDAGPLMTGQVDAIAGWRSNVAQREVLGGEATALPLWDNGVQLFALPYFATGDKIKSDPEMLNGYLRATSRGWDYAFKNPEKAVEILVKAYPNLKAEGELKAVGYLKEFAFSDLTRNDGWGAFDPAVWSSQIALFDELKQFGTDAPKAENLMTTSLLEATKGQRAKLG